MNIFFDECAKVEIHQYGHKCVEWSGGDTDSRLDREEMVPMKIPTNICRKFHEWVPAFNDMK